MHTKRRLPEEFSCQVLYRLGPSITLLTVVIRSPCRNDLAPHVAASFNNPVSLGSPAHCPRTSSLLCPSRLMWLPLRIGRHSHQASSTHCLLRKSGPLGGFAASLR